MDKPQYVSLWSKSPNLPMLESLPESKNVLIFIAGLTDTLATVPYLNMLAESIAPLDFNLVQPQLSSSLGGFGLSSLEADAQEICLVIQHLQTREKYPISKNANIILMGHSTGCQDVVQVLSSPRPDVHIDAAILQAPMSDREDFEAKNPEGSAGELLLKKAFDLMDQGKGATLLPRDEEAPPRKPSTPYKINADAFQKPAMTAYRYWSLFSKGGDDDYFSSDLEDRVMAKIWNTAVERGHRVLALMGAVDEYFAPHVKPEVITAKWKSIASNDHFNAVVVPGANHKVEDLQAQKELMKFILPVVHQVVQEGEQRETDPPMASFDEIVELISTGNAESIPGVKSIPLQINEASPSVSSLQRPPKPWEQNSNNRVAQ